MSRQRIRMAAHLALYKDAFRPVPGDDEILTRFVYDLMVHHVGLYQDAGSGQRPALKAVGKALDLLDARSVGGKP